MTEKIEEILMKDDLFREHFIKIHPPKYEFNGEINPDFLGRNSSLDYAFNWLKDYISFPLIEDKFVFVLNEGHKRKEWRKELISKYGKDAEKFFKNNKLRKNISMGGIYSAISIIDSELGEDYPLIGEKAKELAMIALERSEDYLEMEKSKKIEFVREMENNIYEFLKSLSIKE